MNNKRKKDILMIIIVISSLILLPESYLYFFNDIKDIAITDISIIIFGIIVIVAPIFIVFICRRFNRIERNRINNIIIIILLIILIFYKVSITLYRQAKIINIVNITNKMDMQFSKAKSLNEILEIMELTEQERKYLTENAPELTDTTYFLNTTLGGRDKWNYYNDWKSLYVNRDLIIILCWQAGQKYGFEEKNFKNAKDHYSLVTGEYGDNYYLAQLSKYKVNVDKFTIASNFISIYQIIAYYISFYYMKKKEKGN